MTTEGDDRQLRRAARALLDSIQAQSSAAELEEPHAVIEVDPSTGLIQVIGPFPDGLAALGEIERRKSRWMAETGPPMGMWLPVLIFEA